MTIGMLEIDLFNEQCHSLKEKRQILSSLKKRLKNKFNIAIIESADQDLWQKARLAIVSLAEGRTIVNKTFKEIEDFIFLNYDVQIAQMKISYF